MITTLSVQRSRFIDGNVMKNNFTAGVVSISAESLWDLLSMCWSTGVFYSRHYRATLLCELLCCTTSSIRYTDSPADHTAAPCKNAMFHFFHLFYVFGTLCNCSAESCIRLSALLVNVSSLFVWWCILKFSWQLRQRDHLIARKKSKRGKLTPLGCNRLTTRGTEYEADLLHPHWYKYTRRKNSPEFATAVVKDDSQQEHTEADNSMVMITNGMNIDWEACRSWTKEASGPLPSMKESSHPKPDKKMLHHYCSTNAYVQKVVLITGILLRKIQMNNL